VILVLRGCVTKVFDDACRDDEVHISPVDTRESNCKTFFIRNTLDQGLWFLTWNGPVNDFSMAVFTSFMHVSPGHITPQLLSQVINNKFAPITFVSYVTDGSAPTVGKIEIWTAQSNNVFRTQKRRRGWI